MTRCTARSLTPAAILLSLCAIAPTTLADPPTCSLEVGVLNGAGQIDWYPAGDEEFTAASDGFLRVDADVGEWVGIVADAWILPPTENPPPSTYSALVAAYPFLEQAAPNTPDPLKYGSLPMLYVPADAFESIADAVFEVGILGVPEKETVRKYLQPVMGSSAGPEERSIYGDPVTWIEDLSTEQLDLWKYRAFREPDDSGTPNEIDRFSFEAFWQSVLLEKDPTGADAFFRDRGAFETALSFGLELTLQPIVLNSSANQASDYDDSDPGEEKEKDVPGLEGIATGAVEIGIGDPIVFGVRAPDGSNGPTIDQGPIVASAGEEVIVWLTQTPHKASYVELVFPGGTYICVLKYHGPHQGKFVVPAGLLGLGYISRVVNTWAFAAYSPMQQPLLIEDTFNN